MDFALALYRQLGQRPGNLCFSPFSVRIALAMAEAGARGETAAQIRDVLGVPRSDASAGKGLVPLLKRLEAGGGDSSDLEIANALWSQSGAPLEARFRDVVTEQYNGEVSALDFRGNPEGARATINRWVAARTHERIRDLLPPKSLDAESRLVLANAIHFHGQWELEFSPERTRDEAFYREGGGTVLAPSMRHAASFPYLRADGLQAVELGYRGDRLAMLVLLPDRTNGLKQLEAKLSENLIRDCVAQMKRQQIRLLLPRFEIRSDSFDLVAALRALGMADSFDRTKADFSGINGLRPPDAEALFVSQVFHQARVEVNEAGTKAAAATAMEFSAPTASPNLRSPPPPPEFRADHPFVFAIRERTTGEILFLGRVTDPTR